MQLPTSIFLPLLRHPLRLQIFSACIQTLCSMPSAFLLRRPRCCQGPPFATGSVASGRHLCGYLELSLHLVLQQCPHLCQILHQRPIVILAVSTQAFGDSWGLV